MRAFTWRELVDTSVCYHVRIRGYILVLSVKTSRSIHATCSIVHVVYYALCRIAFWKAKKGRLISLSAAHFLDDDRTVMHFATQRWSCMQLRALSRTSRSSRRWRSTTRSQRQAIPTRSRTSPSPSRRYVGVYIWIQKLSHCFLRHQRYQNKSR